MVFAEFDRRAQRRLAHRMKLGGQVLTAWSYGALGLALAEPMLQRSAFGAGHMIALAFGFACTFLALYIAPEGERDGSH
jgi:hypothetical protein